MTIKNCPIPDCVEVCAFPDDCCALSPESSDDRFLIMHPDEQREAREALTGSKEKVQQDADLIATIDKLVRIGGHSFPCFDADDFMAAVRARFAVSATTAMVPADLLKEATIRALVISGHFCENPDEWLRGHEKRLRELEKIAKAALSSGSEREGQDGG